MPLINRKTEVNKTSISGESRQWEVKDSSGAMILVAADRSEVTENRLCFWLLEVQVACFCNWQWYRFKTTTETT
jgi:hypothetical protein